MNEKELISEKEKMQKIIQNELNRPEYRKMDKKLIRLISKYYRKHDKLSNDQIIFIYEEIIGILLRMRKFESDMFLKEFGLIY